MDSHMTRRNAGLLPRCLSISTSLIFLPIAISLLFVLGCSDEHPKSPKKQNFKEFGEYIEFKLGKENFKIHKAYFQGGGESRWGVLYYAKFWALLPDFETYDRAKNDYEFVERRGWGRKIYFRMHLREKDRNAVAAIVENHMGKGGHKRFSGRLGSPDERRYGLEVYRATNYSPDDYLYRPDGETTVYISCSSKIMNTPSPSCKMRWDPFGSVYADATFSKDYLPQWREILSNIQKIFDGQMVKGD
jgi:hypothetical protein